MTIHDQFPVGSGFGPDSTADDVMAGQDLAGLTALVTGGYSGLGLETTRSLVRAGARVLVPARRPEVARSQLRTLEGTSVIPLDLGDLDSVHRACADLRQAETKLDLLVAAGGVMATPLRRVGAGLESQFAVNHLGHFALVNLLLPLLRKAGGARVVCYSSGGHQFSDIRWNDIHFADGYDKWLAYGQSKTANILFALELDRIGADDGVRAFSLHPGAIMTDLQRHLSRAEQIEWGWIDHSGNVVGHGFRTTAQGAATGLWAATARQLDGAGGLYCEDCDVAPVAAADGLSRSGVRPYALDQHSAERLWEESARLTHVLPA